MSKKVANQNMSCMHKNIVRHAQNGIQYRCDSIPGVEITRNRLFSFSLFFKARTFLQSHENKTHF